MNQAKGKPKGKSGSRSVGPGTGKAVCSTAEAGTAGKGLSLNACPRQRGGKPPAQLLPAFFHIALFRRSGDQSNLRDGPEPWQAAKSIRNQSRGVAETVTHSVCPDAQQLQRGFLCSSQPCSSGSLGLWKSEVSGIMDQLMRPRGENSEDTGSEEIL